MQKIAFTLIDTRKPLFDQLDNKKEFWFPWKLWKTQCLQRPEHDIMYTPMSQVEGARSNNLGHIKASKKKGHMSMDKG